MTGAHLARIARRIVRGETYQAFVAPAIADLQFEAQRGGWFRLRAYAGAWRAIAAAVALELGGDCAATIRAGSVNATIGPALLTLLLTTGVMMPWGVWLEFGRIRPWHHDIVFVAFTFLGALTMVIPAATLPIAAILARRRMPGSMRAAIFVATTAVGVLALAGTAALQRTSALQRELSFASVMSVRAGEAHRPLWKVREMFAQRLHNLDAQSPDPALTRFRAAAADRHAREQRHGTAALLLTVVAYALLGGAWSCVGRWKAAAIAAALFVATLAVRFGFYRVLYVQTVFGALTALWTPVMLFFLTAALIGVRAKGRLKPAPAPVPRDD